MHSIYSPAHFSTHSIECNKCSWTGHGNDTEQEVLLLTDAIEIYCPECEAYLGFVNGEDGGDLGVW